MPNGIHEKQAQEVYYINDLGQSVSYILDKMIKLGLETGSVSNQEEGFFDLFGTNTAGSISNMTYGAGSYVCNNGGPVTCTIQTAVKKIPLNQVAFLRGNWRMEGNGSDSADSNHGTPNNLTYASIGQVGSAGIFNGTNATIDIPYNVNLATSTFSITAWVKPTSRSLTDRNTIFCTQDSDSSGSGFGLVVLDATGSLALRFNNGVITKSHNIMPVTYDAWSFVTLTYDGTTFRGYVNSVLGSTYAAAFIQNTNTRRIGKNTNSIELDSTEFLGSIDEVGYWGSVLDSIDIGSLYNSGSGMNASTYYKAGSLLNTGSTATSVIGVWQGSYSSGTTVVNQFSLDNGATYTTVAQGQLGSISPTTGSLISKLTITRASNAVRDTITSVGVYYG